MRLGESNDQEEIRTRAHRDSWVRSTRRVGESSGLLELPGEVVQAETGDGGHLGQCRAGAEVSLDVLNDGVEPLL